MSTSPILDPQELVVYFHRDLGFCEYHGTRAQLEAEGLIPDGLEWPRNYADLRWESDEFKFFLSRRRPAGAKGPQRQFFNCDWWHLRWEPIASPSLEERRIQRKFRELAAMIQRHSPEGEAEWTRNYFRYMDACQDKGFQAFKALVPGLVPPLRARRAARDLASEDTVSNGGEA